MDQQGDISDIELTAGVQILTEQSEVFAFLSDEEDLYSKDDTIESLP